MRDAVAIVHRFNLKAHVALLRPEQWIKNLFVLAPLYFTPALVDLRNAELALLGFLCFCALSSTVYIINDYNDIEADRLHPVKRTRPLASGAVTAAGAFSLLGLLFAFALALMPYLPIRFAYFALFYLGINIAYSFGFKHVPLLDILIVASGFVLRIEAGAALIDVRPSVWMLICTGLLSLALAVAKRRDDIVKSVDSEHRRSLRGYNKSFLDIVIAITLGALIVSYVNYVVDPAVMARFGTDQLYLTLPFVLAGIMRYLQITLVEEQSGSPTTILLKDRFTQAVVLGWVLVFGILIYG